MKRTIVGAIIVCLTLCWSIESARAELKFQSSNEAACGPATPVKHTILRWKSVCTNDCFVWRLTCSNGKSYLLQSKVHPATTDWQSAFYEWAPWSFALYLLPFLLYAGIAAVGSRAIPLFVLNTLFVLYAAYAAWSLYGSITGNPWGSWVERERLLFLNPYVYRAILGIFVLINLPAVWRALDGVLYRHAPDFGFAPVMLPRDPMHAGMMSAALMPNIHELIDPAETAAHYRRQTERLQALKKRLDAKTALAESILRQRALISFKSDN